MQAAITAANNGHIVTLCEKDHYLGGVLNFAKNIPFKHPLFEFAQILERRVHCWSKGCNRARGGQILC